MPEAPAHAAAAHALTSHIVGAVSAFELFVADRMLDDLRRMVWFATLPNVSGGRTETRKARKDHQT